MKKFIGLLVTLILINPAIAGNKPDLQNPKADWNPVTIYNATGAEIAYIMDGTIGGDSYDIQKGRTDVYHSKTGDEYASFKVGLCLQSEDGNGSLCTQTSAMITCVSGHYNADLIKSITVTTLNSCIVTCLDGSSTSCKQSG